MAAEPFDLAADHLEQRTGLERIEARGTLRIALKLAGLKPKTVSVAQLNIVLASVMPDELEKRGISDAAAVCEQIVEDLAGASASLETPTATDVDAIFGRLADG